MPVPVEKLRKTLCDQLGEDRDLRSTFNSLFDQYFQPYLSGGTTVTLRVSDTSLNSTLVEGASIGRGERLLSRRRVYVLLQIILLAALGFMGIKLISCWSQTRQVDEMFA